MVTEERTNRAKSESGSVVATIASAAVAYALAKGFPMAEIERLTRIKGLDLMNPMARVPDEAVAKMWAELKRRHPDQALSVELAKSAPLQSLAGLAHGAQYAANVREALELCVENRSVLADRLELELLESDREVVFTFAHPLDDVDGGGAAETGLGMFSRVITQVLGVEKAILRVDLSYGGHGPEESYSSFFGVPVRFDGGRHALVLAPEGLDRPSRQANLELFAFAGNYLSQLRRQIEGTPVETPIERLRQAIEHNATHGEFRASSAAARAHMSLRSAQRLASRHGVSLSKLIDDVRFSTVEELLSDPEAPLETIAALVGYSDARALRRAFKRQNGLSTAEFRRRLDTPGDRNRVVHDRVR